MSNQYVNDTKNTLHTVAKPLIAKYHSHLEDAQIVYLWRDKEIKTKGEIVYGEARRAGDLVKHYSGADFVITIYRYGWDKFLMPEKKVALMDHLLSHCKVGLDKDGYRKEDTFGDPMWQLTKPDASMFYDVISRHGAWNESVETLYEVVKRSITSEAPK